MEDDGADSDSALSCFDFLRFFFPSPLPDAATLSAATAVTITLPPGRCLGLTPAVGVLTCASPFFRRHSLALDCLSSSSLACCPSKALRPFAAFTSCWARDEEWAAVSARAGESG